jgi:hypothetical protein
MLLRRRRFRPLDRTDLRILFLFSILILILILISLLLLLLFSRWL